MTLDPRVGVWMSIIAAIGSVLILCGTEFTTLFGSTGSGKILAALGIVNACINGVNGVLHMIPSSNKPDDARLFALGPKPAKGPTP